MSASTGLSAVTPQLAATPGMRVLGFSDWYTPSASGGAERAAWEIYRRLGEAGVRVTVVSATHGEPHADPGVEVRDIRGHDLSRVAGGYFAPAPAAFPAAMRAFKSESPAVLHANTIHYTGCAAAAWLARRTGVPLVVTAQLGPLDHLPARARVPGNAYERTVGRYILRRAARVLAVSNTVRDHVIGLGADPQTVHLAPNGVDHERFGLPAIEPRSTPTVMAIGRLVENKGPDLLLEAAGRLHREGLDFRLVFVGDGPMRRRLTERARALDLDGVASFAGQVADVESHMREADIVVRASYSEGLALAVLEAMAAGRCNVVSDISANLELIADQKTGLTFRSGDVTDLTRALGVAIQAPDQRVELGRAAQRFSVDYTWERMAALHAEAFSAVTA